MQKSNARHTSKIAVGLALAIIPYFSGVIFSCPWTKVNTHAHTLSTRQRYNKIWTPPLSATGKTPLYAEKQVLEGQLNAYHKRTWACPCPEDRLQNVRDGEQLTNRKNARHMSYALWRLMPHTGIHLAQPFLSEHYLQDSNLRNGHSRKKNAQQTHFLAFFTTLPPPQKALSL